MNDPRGELKDALKFKVLDHEGNVERYGDFDHWHFLRGEELPMREIAWSFGHSKLGPPISKDVYDCRED